MHDAVCHVSVPQKPSREGSKITRNNRKSGKNERIQRGDVGVKFRALGEGRQLFGEGNVREICWLLEPEAALCGVDGDGRLHDRLDARSSEGYIAMVAIP